MPIVKIYDMNHQECQEDDILILHYPNENYKWLGVLKFLHESLQFVLHDGDDNWHVLTMSWTKFERVCKFSERPELEKLFGRNELTTKKKKDHFYSIY